MRTRPYDRFPSHSQQGGWGLVEILVAATIGLLLLGGLYTLFSSTQQTFRSQNQLAQLQDNQRLAMIMMTNVVQAAGYFPDPVNLTSTNAFPVTTPFIQAGQFITGTTGAASPAIGGDTITVRYVTASGDGVMNCTGTANTTGSNVTYVNVFSVNAQNNLTCSVNGAAATPLISGVQRLDILYGVDTDSDGSVDTYIEANDMTAANWNTLKSIQLSIIFVNPFASQAGQPPTLAPFTQVISVMGRT